MTILHASSSSPSAFPFQRFNGHNYGDGSITLLIDIGSAVHRCRELVDDDRKIYIDAIMPIHNELHLTKINDDKTYQIVWRTLKIYLYQMFLRDLLHAVEDFPDVNFRYMVTTGENVSHKMNIFEFENKDMRKLVEQGIIDGEAAVAKGKEAHFAKIKDILVKNKLIREDRVDL